MGTEMVKVLLLSLAATELFELVFALAFGVRSRRDYFLVLLVNLLTNPAVVLTYCILMRKQLMSPISATIMLELLAIAVEALCYKLRGDKISHPILFSVGANFFSFSMGMVASLLLSEAFLSFIF